MTNQDVLTIFAIPANVANSKGSPPGNPEIYGVANATNTATA